MENTASISTSKAEGFNWDKVTSWLILALMCFFPFQKRYSNSLKSFSYSFIPKHIEIPSFFSKKIDFFLTDVMIVLIVGLCLYRCRGAIRSFFLAGPAKYLMLFFGVAVVSVSFSITSGYVLQYYRLFQLFLFILLFCAVSRFMETVDKEALIKRILWAFLITGMIQCAIGITQYFFQSPIGLKAFGESNICHFGFPMEAGKRWIFDNWFGFAGTNTVLYRCSGTLPHPNVLGGFLLMSMMINYALIMIEERKGVRNLLYGALFIHVFTLSISFSRAAIIAVVLSSCLWLGLSIWKKNRIRRRLAVLGAVVLSAAVCLGLFYDQFFYRGGIVNYNEIVINADSERVVYQNVAWEMSKDHPVLGGGFNNFQLLSSDYAPQDPSSVLFAKVHNIYLLVLAETGVFGFAFFILFLLAVLKSAFSGMNNEVVLTFFCVFIGLLFIGMCDFYLLQAQHGKTLFFGCAALLYASRLKACR